MRAKNHFSFLAPLLLALLVAPVAHADFLGDMQRYFGIDRTFSSGVPVPDFDNGIKIEGTTVDAASVANISSKIYSSTAASSDLSATTLTTFSTGTATFAAGQVAAGDTIRFRAVVRVKTVDGTDSLRVYVKYAGATLIDTTAIGSVIVDDKLIVDGEITIRSVAASTGTGYYSTLNSGEFGASSFEGGNAFGALSSLTNSVEHTLIVQGIWGGAGNAAVLEQFNVYQS
jgi:hypothetical protein